MKKTIIFLSSLLLLISSSIKATNYYSDPVSGSMSNAGSFVAPWAKLQDIFSANKTFLAGDTIFLRNGNHGYPIVKGVNSNFVVIMPQVNHNPKIDRINFSNTSGAATKYWKLYKLTVQSQAINGNEIWLVETLPSATYITISTCTITTDANTTGWTRNNWRDRCNHGIATREKLNSNIVIEKNLILNTCLGVFLKASNMVFKDNIVKNFTKDATRILASNIVFEGNRVTDLIKVFTTAENHDDLCQAYTTATANQGTDTIKNTIIRRNIFITCTDTTRSFRGTCQGIGFFDGPFFNLTLENNIILVDHWHGLSLYGARNCKIINNTVLDPYKYTPKDAFDSNNTSVGPSWIKIDQKTSTMQSSNNIIRNNISAYGLALSSNSVATKSNNLTIGAISDYNNYFINATNLAQPGNFDLHLKAGSPAIDSGTNTNAPSVDFDGNSRPQGLSTDCGAYEYNAVTTDISSHSKTVNELTVYPNPTKNELNIEFNNGSKIKSYAIYNTVGELIKTENTNDLSLKINLENLISGIYFLQAKSENGVELTKIIKE